MCSYCLFLFLTVPWVGMWCVIEGFPGHTHLLFRTSDISFLGCHIVISDMYLPILSLYSGKVKYSKTCVKSV